MVGRRGHVLQITRNTNRQNTSDLRKHQFHNTHVLQTTVLPALHYPVYLYFFSLFGLCCQCLLHTSCQIDDFFLFLCVSAIVVQYALYHRIIDCLPYCMHFV